ncbi:hypothetical protein GJW-30_1_01590 [Variibacter gotjawalensis]|uniref:Uncharacterized protein n=1 Tax=Variibacter gotjawalensis TaxID=1333996 RepID=A0A0S3PSX1_9BRAD|nr:hypothetical protein [Variibacter gotjawalensis]RZS51227.1 hypothetical protein EV661_3704 [Variibacter gotjawalensis]BAT59061.1 hypothetical protein GJW-30_1_01590 [Variibacter gotjawalensis]
MLELQLIGFAGFALFFAALLSGTRVPNRS